MIKDMDIANKQNKIKSKYVKITTQLSRERRSSPPANSNGIHSRSEPDAYLRIAHIKLVPHHIDIMNTIGAYVLIPNRPITKRSRGIWLTSRKVPAAQVTP
jgi:hypothetical protein